MSFIPKVIFENQNVIVVDKPCGYLSVPSRMGKADPRPVVGIILQDYVGSPIFPVHRLDEETSGLLVFAKTKQAQSILSRSFELHEVQKTYAALTDYKPDFEKLVGGTLKNKLFRGKKRSFEAAHGQNAETFVESGKVTDRQQIYWLLKPKTGRAHQLRVQLSMRGFPIVGDNLYGSQKEFPTTEFLPELSLREKAICLRAIELDFSKTKGIEALEMPVVLKVNSWQ